MLILASQSPRRAELLQAAGIEFRVVVPEVEDAPPPRARSSAALVQRIALRKAQSVADRREPGRPEDRAPTAATPVLGADTIVVCAGQILGKPADGEEARQMLSLLSGRRHWVYTGLALVLGERRRTGYERTAVTFRELSEADIDRYLGTGEPVDKAGAYAIQGLGGALIAGVSGCYTNVIGLPVPRLLAMLSAL